MIDLSIIIVNYNKRKLVAECIDSIYKNLKELHYEIIVVDNYSQDGSCETIRIEFPDVSLIENKENYGFSYANNQGADVANGKFLYFLNNDTKLLTDGYLGLIETFYGTNVGIVGPKLLNSDMTPQRQGSLFGSRFWSKKKAIKTGFVIGAALIMPRELFFDIGMFDESFLFYNEDLDLCRKVKDRGYDIVFYPTVEVMHYGGTTSKYLSEFSIIEGYKGTLYYIAKHYGHLYMRIYKIAILIDIYIRILKCHLIYPFDKHKDKLRVMLDSYRKAKKIIKEYN